MDTKTAKSDNKAPEINLAELLPLLEQSGQFTEEQIANFVDLHTQRKYEPETIEIIKPEFWFESDRDHTLGNKKIKIRFLNGWDISRLTPKIDNIYKAVTSENPDKKDGSPGKLDPVSLAAIAFDQVTKERANGTKTPLLHTIYEELALLASTDKQEITTDYMYCVPIGQVKDFIIKFVQVNQQDFLELWGIKHDNLGSVVSTLIGKIFSLIGKVRAKLPESLGGSDGGVNNIGQTTSGIPSKKQARQKTPVTTR